MIDDGSLGSLGEDDGAATLSILFGVFSDLLGDFLEVRTYRHLGVGLDARHVLMHDGKREFAAKLHEKRGTALVC